MKKKMIEFKINIYKIIGLLIIILGICLTLKILVPMALRLVYMFLALTKLYTLLDMTGKFYGGCFFLVIFWYLFSALANIIYYLFKYGFKLLKINSEIAKNVK